MKDITLTEESLLALLHYIDAMIAYKVDMELGRNTNYTNPSIFEAANALEEKLHLPDYTLPR